MASTNNYKAIKSTEFLSMYTNPRLREDATIDVPSFVSKYYASNEYDAVVDKYNNDYDDDDGHTEEEEEEEDEAHARNITILDLVVHVEEIQSQLENLMGMHQSFCEMNERWSEGNAKFVTKSGGDRVSWIINETRKKNTLDKMGTSFEQIQDEIAVLSLKSKDLYREHSLQQLNRQHQRIRRSIQTQQKKKRQQQQLHIQQQQQYLNKPPPITPMTTGIIPRSKPIMGLPPRPPPPPRPFTMQQRIQTQ